MTISKYKGVFIIIDRTYRCEDFTFCKKGDIAYVGYFGNKKKKLFAHLIIAVGCPRGNDGRCFDKISKQEFNEFPANQKQLYEKFSRNPQKYKLIDECMIWSFTEEDYNKIKI